MSRPSQSQIFGRSAQINLQSIFVAVNIDYTIFSSSIKFVNHTILHPLKKEHLLLQSFFRLGRKARFHL